MDIIFTCNSSKLTNSSSSLSGHKHLPHWFAFTSSTVTIFQHHWNPKALSLLISPNQSPAHFFSSFSNWDAMTHHFTDTFANILNSLALLSLCCPQAANPNGGSIQLSAFSNSPLLGRITWLLLQKSPKYLTYYEISLANSLLNSPTAVVNHFKPFLLFSCLKPPCSTLYSFFRRKLQASNSFNFPFQTYKSIPSLPMETRSCLSPTKGDHSTCTSSLPVLPRTLHLKKNLIDFSLMYCPISFYI